MRTPVTTVAKVLNLLRTGGSPVSARSWEAMASIRLSREETAALVERALAAYVTSQTVTPAWVTKMTTTFGNAEPRWRAGLGGELRQDLFLLASVGRMDPEVLIRAASKVRGFWDGRGNRVPLDALEPMEELERAGGRFAPDHLEFFARLATDETLKLPRRLQQQLRHEFGDVDNMYDADTPFRYALAAAVQRRGFDALDDTRPIDGTQARQLMAVPASRWTVPEARALVARLDLSTNDPSVRALVRRLAQDEARPDVALLRRDLMAEHRPLAHRLAVFRHVLTPEAIEPVLARLVGVCLREANLGAATPSTLTDRAMSGPLRHWLRRLVLVLPSEDWAAAAGRLIPGLMDRNADEDEPFAATEIGRMLESWFVLMDSDPTPAPISPEFLASLLKAKDAELRSWALTRLVPRTGTAPILAGRPRGRTPGRRT